MRALVLGIDGYLGWSLTCELVSKGHAVMGVDNHWRRELVRSEGSISAIPIESLDNRTNVLNDVYKTDVGALPIDIAFEYDMLAEIISFFKPTVIFQLAQMPSAPWSMKTRQNCLKTHVNNMHGMLNLLFAVKEIDPSIHIVKIGTMGEYGQPNIPIPEGNSEITINGRTDSLPFPRAAGSWYHQTKVHDTHNIRMACSMWGLSCTDVMQGIVYGSRVGAMGTTPELATRLDFDECFGTIINRFVVQAAIKHPLTVYGMGTQVRSILPLQDSINCLMLLAKNPPKTGEYREVNQFHEYFSLNEMAEIVHEAYYELTGDKPEINHIRNPRTEKDKHFYAPEAKILNSLGYKNSECIQKTVRCMLINVLEYRTILENYKRVVTPTVTWTGDTYSASILHKN